MICGETSWPDLKLTSWPARRGMTEDNGVPAPALTRDNIHLSRPKTGLLPCSAVDSTGLPEAVAGYVRASLSQRNGDCGAEPGGRASDQRKLSVEMKPVKNPHCLPISILWLHNEIVNDGKNAGPGLRDGLFQILCLNLSRSVLSLQRPIRRALPWSGQRVSCGFK